MSNPPASEKSRSGQGKGAVALIVLACVCSVLALALTWVRNQTLDTDRYVATVAPLAQNKAIQGAVTDAVTAQLVSAVQPQKLVAESLPEKAAPLAGPIAKALTGFVRDLIGKLVASKQFETLWKAISRESHAQMVAVLTGKRTALNTLAAKGEIRLNLAAVVGPAKAFLDSQGIDTAQLDSSPSLVIFDLSALTTAQGAVKALKGLTLVFTILGPALFLLAVALSRARRRTIITAGLSLAGAMALLGILLAVGRWFYLDSLGPNVPKDAAAAFFDILVRYLGIGVRITAIVGLLVALAAWWSGPGRKAVSDLDGDGLVPVIRVAIIGIGAVILLAASHPTAIMILLTVAATALLAVFVAPVAARLNR